MSCICCRYLRATKWETAAAAIGRLEGTLKWRREYGLYDKVNAASLEPEVGCCALGGYPCMADWDVAQAVTGKEILFGFDVQGRPALYTPPNRQSTTDPVRQVQFVVWMLERCIDQMQAGVE